MLLLRLSAQFQGSLTKDKFIKQSLLGFIGPHPPMWLWNRQMSVAFTHVSEGPGQFWEPESSQLSLSTSCQRLKWLLLFQILIVDGQELRHNPASVMDNIQKFLGVTPLFNYTQALR